MLPGAGFSDACVLVVEEEEEEAVVLAGLDEVECVLDVNDDALDVDEDVFDVVNGPLVVDEAVEDGFLDVEDEVLVDDVGVLDDDAVLELDEPFVEDEWVLDDDDDEDAFEVEDELFVDDAGVLDDDALLVVVLVLDFSGPPDGFCAFSLSFILSLLTHNYSWKLQNTYFQQIYNPLYEIQYCKNIIYPWNADR